MKATLEEEKLAAQIKLLRDALLKAPPLRSIEDERYRAWCLNVKEPALKATE